MNHHSGSYERLMPTHRKQLVESTGMPRAETTTPVAAAVEVYIRSCCLSAVGKGIRRRRAIGGLACLISVLKSVLFFIKKDIFFNVKTLMHHGGVLLDVF